MIDAFTQSVQFRSKQFIFVHFLFRGDQHAA